MSKEIEKLENIANKFKEKYPEAEKYLDGMVYRAKKIEDDANQCLVFLLLGEYEDFGAKESEVNKVSDMDPKDGLELLKTEIEFNLYIEKTLREKCKCDIPFHPKGYPFYFF